MRRRGFLATVGTAAIAGCGSDGGDGEGTSEASPSREPETAATSTATADAQPSPRPLRGVSLSPRSFGGEDVRSFFDQAADAGSVVRWAGDWTELDPDGGAPAAVATLARQHDLEPVIETGVFSAGDRELFRPLTGEARAEYVESAASFCERHAPPYLGIGVEVDAHSETDPDSFETFVDLFADTYDAVKAVSPDTLVYTGFQLERIRGLRGGLFGGENDPGAANWALIDRFPDADLTAVTTNPGLIYRDPGEVPDDYYDELAARTDRPVAITETGWTHRTVAEGWESDEAEQADFVERLAVLTSDVDLEMLVWLWLYEQPDPTGAFEGMSLRREDGSGRPAWDVWVERGQ